MSEVSAAEFQANRSGAPVGIGLSALIAVSFLVGGAVQSDPGARWLCLGVAALSAYGMIRCIMFALDRRVVLSIGPAGLMYRWFSPKTIAWSEITAITVSRYYRYGKLLKNNLFVTGALVKNQTHVHLPANDTINFAVSDFRQFPNGIFRALARAGNRSIGNPPVAIQIASIAGSSDEIVATIRHYWQGDIVRRDIKASGAGLS